MAYIPKALREQVIERAKGLCEYCQTSQQIIITLEIDHILPISLGGKTELDNLCLACGFCNTYKNNRTEAIDPETNTRNPLFHPRQQNWRDHFIWDVRGTHLIGLTGIGRATIVQLQINHPMTVRSRQIWVASGWHPPK